MQKKIHLKRLNRKTICFSKNEQIHDNVIVFTKRGLILIIINSNGLRHDPHRY
ncbi:MAG: IS1 family transposase [Tannerella sp.]|nr:IS1 family transposase [Tannerella sp.]